MYVEAACRSTKPEDDKQEEPLMIFLCLPYFQLAPLSGQTPSRIAKSHQMRTLLQYLNGHTSKRRDLQQTVCHIDRSLNGQCFHVSYLWCMIVGSGRLENIVIRITIVDIPRLTPYVHESFATRPTTGNYHSGATIRFTRCPRPSDTCVLRRSSSMVISSEGLQYMAGISSERLSANGARSF